MNASAGSAIHSAGQYKKVWLIFISLSLIAQSGCTIVQMRKNNEDTQTRIDEKHQELNNLQATQSQLAADSDRLKKDLQQREVNAKELRARLDELIQVNAAAPASSPKQLADKQERHRQLQTVRQQAQALEQSGDLSDEQKRKSLEELRARTVQLLKLLMVG